MRALIPIAALLWGSSFSCMVSGQEAGQPQAAARSDTAVTDEIIVRGSSRAVIRAEIEKTENAFFERFNEINSDNEYDVHCRWEAVTGSKMLRRRCQPNFWRAADEHIGEETARALQGSATVNTQQFMAEQHYKSLLLRDEMLKLAAGDEALLATLVRLANLRQTLADGEDLRGFTASREVSAQTGELSYDAQMMVEVRIGRQPWSYRLTQRTFTLAQVFGEIRSIGVDCEGHSTRLDYAEGVEWSLPDTWGACIVTVDAKRNTTFALYEFE